MPSLGPQTPSSTYGNLLQLHGGATTSLKQVESGSGSGTPLYLSTSSVRLDAALLVGPDAAMTADHPGQVVLSSGPTSSGRAVQTTLGPVLVASVPQGNTSYHELLTRDTSGRLTLPDHHACVYRLQVVAVSEVGSLAAWEVHGRVLRGSGAASVSGSCTVASVGTTPSGWDLTCAADTGVGGLLLQGKTDGAAASFAASVWRTQLGWSG